MAPNLGPTLKTSVLDTSDKCFIIRTNADFAVKSFSSKHLFQHPKCLKLFSAWTPVNENWWQNLSFLIIIIHYVSNWFWVRKVHQRVTEPHVKFYERQEFITLWYNMSFVSIWRSNAWRSALRKNSLLQTVRCIELAHKNCYAVSQHPLWTSDF